MYLRGTGKARQAEAFTYLVLMQYRIPNHLLLPSGFGDPVSLEVRNSHQKSKLTLGSYGRTLPNLSSEMNPCRTFLGGGKLSDERRSSQPIRGESHDQRRSRRAFQPVSGDGCREGY